MAIDFSPDKPIYQQLIDRISGDILKGMLDPGERLPSVREYAVEVGVNANTMQRVYKELEQMALTETKRGQGSFVTEDLGRITQLREEVKERLAAEFLQSAKAFGFTTAEMMAHLQQKEENV